jgi:hypothetical protein
MLDLQGVVVMEDDPFDDQLKDGLPFRDAGCLQTGTDAPAERAQARQGFPALSPLLAQAAALFVLVFKDAPLFGQGATLLGKLVEADHLGLVGLQKAAVGTAQPVQAGLQLADGLLFPVVGHGAPGDEPLELSQQLGGIAEQADDVIPDHRLQGIRLDARPRAFRVATGRQGIGPGAAVVAPAGSASLSGKIAPVDAQAAGAAFQQAAQ